MPKRQHLPESAKNALRKQLAEVASEGGKARWANVDPEERRRLMSAAGKKSAASRRKKTVVAKRTRS